MSLTDPELHVLERYERIMLTEPEPRLSRLFWIVLALAIVVLALGAAFIAIGGFNV